LYPNIEKSKSILLLKDDPQPKGSTEMSTDWDKYSTSTESLNKAKVPSDNGILAFNVGDVRNSPFPLMVRHDPVSTDLFINQAHSVIFSVPLRKNDLGIRLKLRDISFWSIEV
jgi:hypothetical protein